MNKGYFNDLRAKGVALPSYTICPSGNPILLGDLLKNRGWEKAVVKPAVSGGAYNTWVTNAGAAAADQERFSILSASGDVIVQSFVEEIITE